MVQRPNSIFCLVFFVLLTWPQKHKQYFVWPFFLTQAEKPNHVWSFPPWPKNQFFFWYFFFSFLTLAQKPKSILYLVFLFSRPKPQNGYQTLIMVIRESDPKVATLNPGTTGAGGVSEVPTLHDEPETVAAQWQERKHRLLGWGHLIRANKYCFTVASSLLPLTHSKSKTQKQQI